MPGFNGMGFRGAGPMTGRGRGYCIVCLNRGAGADPGFARRGERGARVGRSGCRGWWNGANATGFPHWSIWMPGADPVSAVFAPPASAGSEFGELKEQAGNQEKALDWAQKRIVELELRKLFMTLQDAELERAQKWVAELEQKE